MLLLLRLTQFRSSRILLAMPVTRSRSKASGGSVDQPPIPEPPKLRGKRKTTSNPAVKSLGENPAPQKKTRIEKQPVANSRAVGTAVVPNNPGSLPALVPAELSFSFEEAKQHLITADPRFQDVFDTAVCTPYQKLDRVEPFR